MDGIKSKDRVQQFGEVFTPDSIVNDMLDLVDNEIKDCSDNEYILKTYLEPACGDGQFLIRILSRKLEKVCNLPVEQRQLALVKAVSSIYGVDIQLDNVLASRERMMRIIKGEEVDTFDLKNKTNIIKVDLGIEITPELENVLKIILEYNIIHGNTLEPQGNTETAPIFINEYIFSDNNVRIDKFPFNQLEGFGETLGSGNYLGIPDILSSGGYQDTLTNEDGEDSYDF